MQKDKRDWSRVQRTKAPHQVSLRLTAEENQRLEEAAERLGVSKAGYLKSTALGVPISKASRRPPAVAADLRRLLGHMGKLGSNANQIARLCNNGTITDQHLAAESLQRIQRELVAMRALLLEALNVEP